MEFRGTLRDRSVLPSTLVNLRVTLGVRSSTRRPTSRVNPVSFWDIVDTSPPAVKNLSEILDNKGDQAVHEESKEKREEDPIELNVGQKEDVDRGEMTDKKDDKNLDDTLLVRSLVDTHDEHAEVYETHDAVEGVGQEDICKEDDSPSPSSIGRQMPAVQINSLMKVLRQAQVNNAKSSEPHRKSFSSRPKAKPKFTSRGLAKGKSPSVAAENLNNQDIRNFLTITRSQTHTFNLRGKVVENEGEILLERSDISENSRNQLIVVNRSLSESDFEG